MIRKISTITVFLVLMAIAAPLSLDAHVTLQPSLQSEMKAPHVLAPVEVSKTKEVLTNSIAANFVATRADEYKERMLKVLNNNCVLSGSSTNNVLSRQVKARIDAKAAILLSKAALAKSTQELAAIKSQAELAFPIAPAVAG